MADGNKSTTVVFATQATNKGLSVGYQNIAFAHESPGDETSINLASLITPPEMLSNGFLQPSASAIANAELLFHQRNIMLVSSLRGVLIPMMSYRVSQSTRIQLLGNASPTLANEVFYAIVSPVATTGLTMVGTVDRAPVTETLLDTFGTVAIGNTITPNKYENTQAGEVKVYVDGIRMFRNPGNSDTVLDGDYYETEATIVLNDTTGSRDVLVEFENLSEDVDGAQKDQINVLAGQLDLVIESLSNVTGNPTSAYQSAVNFPTLKVFADSVIDNTSKVAELLSAQVPIVTEWADATADFSFNNMGTITVKEIQSKRVGDTMHVKGSFVTGTVAAADIEIVLPLSAQLDGAKSSATHENIQGRWYGLRAAPFNIDSTQSGPVFFDSTSFDKLFVANTTQSQTLQKTNANDMHFSGDVVTFGFSYPVDGWAATLTLAAQLGL